MLSPANSLALADLPEESLHHTQLNHHFAIQKQHESRAVAAADAPLHSHHYLL